MRIGVAADPSARYRRLPDGETELMVSYGSAGSRAQLIGTRTRALDKATELGASAILVRFRLGAAHAFFGRPMSELTDLILPVGELWKEHEMQPLQAAESELQLVAAVTEVLQSRLTGPYEPAPTRSVRRALAHIAQARVLPRVPELATQIGVSERQLRRRFDQVLGMSPKHYLRVVRFQRALRMARSTRHKPNWAALAEACGYFDQAHLIADFREMAGVTPSVFLG